MADMIRLKMLRLFSTLPVTWGLDRNQGMAPETHATTAQAGSKGKKPYLEKRLSLLEGPGPVKSPLIDGNGDC